MSATVLINAATVLHGADSTVVPLHVLVPSYVNFVVICNKSHTCKFYVAHTTFSTIAGASELLAARLPGLASTASETLEVDAGVYEYIACVVTNDDPAASAIVSVSGEAEPPIYLPAFGAPLDMTSQPVAIYQGDDYSGGDGRAITFSYAVADTPNLIGSDCQFKAREVTFDSTDVYLSADGLYYIVVFEPSAAETVDLISQFQGYEVEAVLADTHVVTLEFGILTVYPDISVVT